MLWFYRSASGALYRAMALLVVVLANQISRQWLSLEGSAMHSNRAIKVAVINVALNAVDAGIACRRRK